MHSEATNVTKGPADLYSLNLMTYLVHFLVYNIRDSPPLLHYLSFSNHASDVGWALREEQCHRDKVQSLLRRSGGLLALPNLSAL